MLSRAKWLFGVFALFLAVQGGAARAQGLAAEYYSHTNVVGGIERTDLFAPANLKVERIDRQINFNWGSGAPDSAVGADNFGVRWFGQIQFPTAGEYEIIGRSDDGIRVWIQEGAINPNADAPIIDSWVDRGPTDSPAFFTADTNGSTYNILVEYYENGGGAVAVLDWIKPNSETRETIPSANLIPPAAELAKYGTVNGKVVDNTGRAVAGAEVVAIVDGARYTGVTGGDGTYSILAKAGAATLSLTDTSLKGDAQQVTVTAGQTVTAPNITLSIVAPLNLILESGYQWTAYLSSDIMPEDDYSAVTLSAEDQAKFVDFNVTATNGNWQSIVEAAELSNPSSIDGWARLSFTVPQEWETQYAGKPLTLYGFNFNAADETFFNGTLVGKTGRILKDESTQRDADRIREYTIPANLVRYGQENVIAIHGWHDGGSGAFTSARPKLAVQLEPPRTRLTIGNDNSTKRHRNDEDQPYYDPAILQPGYDDSGDDWQTFNTTSKHPAVSPPTTDVWERIRFKADGFPGAQGAVLTNINVSDHPEAIWINGTPIGSRTENNWEAHLPHSFLIPPGVLNTDGTDNVLVVRVVNESGTSGLQNPFNIVSLQTLSGAVKVQLTGADPSIGGTGANHTATLTNAAGLDVGTVTTTVQGTADFLDVNAGTYTLKVTGPLVAAGHSQQVTVTNGQVTVANVESAKNKSLATTFLRPTDGPWRVMGNQGAGSFEEGPDSMAPGTNVNFDTSEWGIVRDMPGNWKDTGNNGLGDFGLGDDMWAWARVEFNLPTSFNNGQDLVLDNLTVDDDDITFLNGVEVNRQQGYGLRSITLPFANLKFGDGEANQNVLAFAIRNGGGDFSAAQQVTNMIRVRMQPEAVVLPTCKGDANGDGAVNVADAVAILQHAVNIGTPLSGQNLSNAQVAGDTEVNVADAVAVLQAIVGVSPGKELVPNLNCQ